MAEAIIAINYFNSSIGELILGSYQSQLCICDWRFRKQRDLIDGRIKGILNTEYEEKNCSLLNETKAQLNLYFEKKLIDFDLPLLLVGSNFQKKVWEALLKVKYGKTSTYLDLAKSINAASAIRAVAAANGANALSIIIPCHRIIGSNGALTGYAGGLPTKKKLLQLENKSQTELW